MEAIYTKKTFFFKNPSGTSRGVLTEKLAYILEIHKNDKVGIGECSIIEGLSPDFLSVKDYEKKLNDVCNRIDYYSEHLEELKNYPSILFGIETALLNLNFNEPMLYFDNLFSKGKQKIAINGLVWMGEKDFMLRQVQQKINEGYKCIKIKVGAIDFDRECEILEEIRLVYDESKIEIRLDANGAFEMSNVFDKLNVLSKFHIHSIEQPIKQGSPLSMKNVVLNSPIPIALDEELIGVNSILEKKALLEGIKPDYIILKPSLHGGLIGTTEWISVAESLKIKWWITSALESNIGLSAIAQFVSEFNIQLPQGLGTGSLYTNNIPSHLEVKNGFIYSDNSKK